MEKLKYLPLSSGYMTKRLFPPSVLGIQRCMDELLQQDSHGLGMVRWKRLGAAIEREASRHSVEMEHLGLANGRRKEIIAEALERQRRAWDYAMDTIGRNQAYTPRDLALLATMLVPHQTIHPRTGFRTYDVMLSGASHVPPGASKVEGEMNDLIEQVGSMTTPLEKAVFSHFHIARIHPFEDGNGRVARVVQNALMMGANYLPVPTRVDQRDAYISTLDRGVVAYNGGDRKRYLKEFAQFIVNNLAEAKEFYRQSVQPLRRRIY